LYACIIRFEKVKCIESVGAVCSRERSNLRLQAAPTGVFWLFELAGYANTLILVFQMIIKIVVPFPINKVWVEKQLFNIRIRRR